MLWLIYADSSKVTHVTGESYISLQCISWPEVISSPLHVFFRWFLPEHGPPLTFSTETDILKTTVFKWKQLGNSCCSVRFRHFLFTSSLISMCTVKEISLLEKWRTTLTETWTPGHLCAWKSHFPLRFSICPSVKCEAWTRWFLSSFQL